MIVSLHPLGSMEVEPSKLSCIVCSNILTPSFTSYKCLHKCCTHCVPKSRPPCCTIIVRNNIVIQLAVLRCERKALCGVVLPTFSAYSQHTGTCFSCKTSMRELQHIQLRDDHAKLEAKYTLLEKEVETLNNDNANLKRGYDEMIVNNDKLTVDNEQLKRRCTDGNKNDQAEIFDLRIELNKMTDDMAKMSKKLKNEVKQNKSLRTRLAKKKRAGKMGELQAENTKGPKWVANDEETETDHEDYSD